MTAQERDALATRTVADSEHPDPRMSLAVVDAVDGHLVGQANWYFARADALRLDFATYTRGRVWERRRAACRSSPGSVLTWATWSFTRPCSPPASTSPSS